MRLNKLSVAAAVGIGVLAGGASASTIQYATSVSATNEYGDSFCDVGTSNGSRYDICNSLGMEDGDRDGGFTSSGNFQELNYFFSTNFTAPVYIWEITGDRNPNWIERLDYEFFAVGTGGDSVLGTITNASDGVPDGKDRWKITFSELAGGPFNRLRVVRNGGPGDGFDIDAIGVSPVPLPAGGLLLLTALGGLAIARRKRKAA